MYSILPLEDNPALRLISKEIPKSEIKGTHVQKLISEMKKLLSKEEYGVALAAVQVGEPVRLFIVSGKALARGSRNAPDEDVRQKKVDLPDADDQVYINPVILKKSRGKINKHEGCLSIRGKWGIVPRAEKATVRARDEHGTEFTRGAAGFLAHIFQHEMDHLEGILYIDKALELFDDTEKETTEHDDQ
jgi:peptide deformylase